MSDLETQQEGLRNKTLPSTTDDKTKLSEPGEPGEITRSSNNTIVLYSLTSIAMLCAGISAGVLYFNPDGAKDILQITFQPVLIIVGGLIGFIKS